MNIYIRFIAFTLLMLSVYFFMFNHHDIITPLLHPLSSFPTTVGEWRMSRDSQFDQKTLELLRPTDYMAKRYTRFDGAIVDLYIGYHDGASKAGPLHSPKNCLPGAGWFEASSRLVSIPLNEGFLNTVVAVYEQGLSKEIFIYWFQVGGKSVHNEYTLKLHEILNSIRYGRRDTAFIRISVPILTSSDDAQQFAESFLRSVYPFIRQFLPS